MRTVKIVINTPNVNVFADDSKKKTAKALTEELLVGFLQQKLRENLKTWINEFDESLKKELDKVEEIEKKKDVPTSTDTEPNPNKDTGKTC